jgi:hypothetical protein
VQLTPGAGVAVLVLHRPADALLSVCEYAVGAGRDAVHILE